MFETFFFNERFQLETKKNSEKYNLVKFTEILQIKKPISRKCKNFQVFIHLRKFPRKNHLVIQKSENYT